MHRLTQFSLRRPWLTLAVLLAITVGLGSGLPRVKSEHGFRVLLGGDHPAIQRAESMIDEFAGGYPMHIAWQCGVGQPCQTIFDENSLRMADQITKELSTAQGIDQVRSPSNTPLMISGESGFAIRYFLENDAVASDASELAAIAVEDPLWKNKLVSANAKVGAIVVQPVDIRSETDLIAIDAIERALAPYREKGQIFHLAGSAPSAILAGRDLAESMGRVVPLLVLVIVAIVLLLTRSWQQTLVTLVTMGVGLLWTFGLLGWLAWPKDGILEILAPLLLVVGVCDAVHLLARYASEKRATDTSAERALLSAARSINAACVITTLTTAVAFVSFATSNLDTFVRFGSIAAFGVIACLVLTFSLLPVLARHLPKEARQAQRASAGWNQVMDSLVQLASRRARPLLLVCGALALFFALAGMTRLSVEQNWRESFGEDSPSMAAERFLEKHFATTSSLEVDITLPPQTSVEDPQTLAAVTKIGEELAKLEGLSGGYSVNNLLARMNRLVHENDTAFDTVGTSHAANAELLELLSMGDGRLLANWLSLDRSRLRLSLDSSYMPHSKSGPLLAAARERVAAVAPAGWDLKLVGQVALNHDWVIDIQRTQFTSFPLALAIVFVLVSVFLRSWKLGLLALVPPIFAVAITLGSMGFAGATLDVARAMIAAIVLGLGVDDSIHVLSHYRAQRATGQAPQPAMRAALRHSGRALVTTSIALALGFLTLTLSAWATVSSFGLFVSLAILGALMAALFVLPAIVFAFAGNEAPASKTSSTAPGALAQEPR